MGCPNLSNQQIVESTAFHEAAHALMVILLGYEIFYVTIIPDDKHSGCVSHSCPPGTKSHILVSQAGAACLDLYGIQSGEYGGALEDVKDARNDVAQLIPDNGIEPLGKLDRKRENLLSRALKLTKEFLGDSDVKAAVVALAGKLLLVRYLCGADVENIVAPLLGSAKTRFARRVCDRLDAS